MLLPISRNALFRLLTGYSHHPESRLLTMTEIVVVKFRQFTLTIRTTGMEKDDDRPARETSGREDTRPVAREIIHRKGRQAIAHPDETRLIRIRAVFMRVDGAANKHKRHQ